MLFSLSLPRLILPYERFTKGEEDKPLPPAKPRKLEAGPQEGGVAKTKAGSTVKRPKEEQSQKPKGDKDAAAIVLEPSVSVSYYLHLFICSLIRNSALYILNT